MHEYKLLDAKQTKIDLQKYIDRVEKQLCVVHQVIDALKRMEGRTLNKRIATALGKQLPMYSFLLSTPYTWYNLKIWESGVFRHNLNFDAIDLNLGYTNNTTSVDLSKIDEHNQRYLLDEGRLVEYRAKLNTIDQDCEKYNQAIRALHEAEAGLEPVRFIVTQPHLLW